jgi:hypothetical protein
MPESNCTITFTGPFAAKPGMLEFEFPLELQSCYGLYLWTIPFENGYLVNYVGKTKRTFPARFLDHKKWSENGRDVCDPDVILKGENWLLDCPTLDQTIRLYACWRIFLAALDVDDASLLAMESALIQKLLQSGGKCSYFLGNKQKKPRSPEGKKLQVRIESDSLIHGIGSELTI